MERARLQKGLAQLRLWYREQARPLPWRQASPDPYAVWISEVMSQQSTMATVLPYFERWMKKFPSVQVLAAASEDEVVSSWAGLGYYSRARNVRRAAQSLQARLEATGWPRDVEAWRELPGVGPYTAAAVAAIAFGAAVLPVDGNVIRVTARLFGIEDPLNSPSDRKLVEARVAEMAALAQAGSHGDLAQAFMDLGSSLCRAGALAQCALCPLASLCQARREETFASMPRPKRRAEAEKIAVAAYVYRNKGELLLRRIPEGQRLGGQWELPSEEIAQARLEEMRQKYELLGPVSHSITRFRYQAYGVNAGPWSKELPPEHRFWRPGSPLAAPLTTLSRKVLALLDISP
jgi:A/G-specific adenine glycosylase